MSRIPFEIMDDITAWLRANDIEPTRVPIHEVPWVRNGKVTTRVFLHRNGRPYLIPNTDRIAEETITVPLKVEPPAVLAAWLAGKP